MGVLRNPQHEAAAQHLAGGKASVEGGNLVREAAEIGGLDPRGKSFASNAKRFVQRKDLKARVAEIQQIGAALASVSTGSLIVEAEQARLKAMREKSGSSAAVQAIICKGKLAGIWRDKIAMTDPNGDGPAIVEVRWRTPENSPA